MSTRTEETGGHTVIGSGEAELHAWRLGQLKRAGYTGNRADELAGRYDIDLHVACDLVASGCPEETAFAILS